MYYFGRNHIFIAVKLLKMQKRRKHFFLFYMQIFLRLIVLSLSSYPIKSKTNEGRGEISGDFSGLELRHECTAEP